MGDIKGKVILLTGASEGIGRALAKVLAREGARLLLTARNQDRLQSLLLELPKDCGAKIHAADLSLPLECEELVDVCLTRFGALDIVIHNAGMTMWTRFDELQDLSVLERVMRVNYFGPVYLTKAALPHLKASRGQLVAVASVAGLTGVPTRSGYAASKHALMGFFDSLRIELMDEGVAVTQICPDFVVSQIHKRALDAQGQPLGETPMQESRIISAEACAEMMLPAIANRQRLLITSWRGRLSRWLKLLAPELIDRLALKAISRGH
ncbi:SDR family oxidoreductase [Shewanella cyperi]|uniref:SDR family oxidoreductase n=1 Tax=Shewanella cyperi TaxID=2814292 RepID=A0A975AKU5_9GAMM|nr:SDR family oxidoreductase [Shewanella cyperi]QSX29732.1 SDR family oxidoreductase [Shewanella cyperi]